MQHTTNYNLKMPESTDPVQVSDLSENFSSIDALIKAASQGGAKIAAGSYTGTGTYGSSSPTKITFPFPPKMVAVLRDVSSNIASSEGAIWTGQSGSSTQLFFSVSGNTLSYYNTSSGRGQLNLSGAKYFYAAVG